MIKLKWISVRMSDWLWEGLKKLADAENSSMARIMRNLIEKEIKARKMK